MSSFQRIWNSRSDARRMAGCGAIVVCAGALAACSANVARLDQPGFGLSDTPRETAAVRPTEGMATRRSGAGGPVEDSSAGWPSSGPRDANARPYSPPPAAPGVRVTSLPEPTGAPGSAQPRSFATLPPAKIAAARAPTPPVQKRAIPAGQTIDVVQGDTLYGLSKRHGVSIAALMEVNALQNPNLKPGQKIVLPRGAKAPYAKPQTTPGAVAAAPARLPIPAATPAPAPAAAAVPAAAPTPSAAVAAWAGSYTVKPGESLYGIARAHRVTLNDIQAANGIADANKVRPGSNLKVPAGVVPAVVAEAPAQPTAPLPPSAPRVIQKTTAAAAPALPAAVPAAPATKAGMTPRIINGGAAQVAARTDTAVDASAFDTPPTEAPAAPAKPAAKTAAAIPAAATGGAAKMRWPVKGKVIAEFGKRADGTHNDGVNLAVPAGTDVAAADQGTVAYAGSELKGYGNLVLIRHDNGLVTAYAHNDSVLVKRGDTVKRGQVIAKAGKSGTVDQPQVHFELRNGSKPVDPTPYMEKM